MSNIRIVSRSVRHDQGCRVGVPQSQRSEQVAVFSDPIGRVAGVTNEDLLSDEEQAASSSRTIDVESPVSLAELHQVDAGQIASGVVEEHVLAAGIAGVDWAEFGQVCHLLIVVSY